MYAFLGVFAIGLVRGDCLSNTTLTALGFTPIAPTAAPTNNTLCTTAVQNAQFCVNTTQIANLTATQRNAVWASELANFTQALNNAANATANLQNLCQNTITTANANANRKINNVTITSTMVSNCTSLNSTAASFTNYLTGSSASTVQTNCQNGVANLINSAYCLFSTSSASTFISSALQFTVTQSTPSAVVQQCMPYVMASCFTNELALFLDQFTKNTTGNSTFLTTCGPSSTLAQCITNPSACTSVLPGLFTNMFTPTGSRMSSGLVQSYAQSLQTVSGYTLVRRLQTTSSSTPSSSFVVASNSTGGYNIAGASTGLNTTISGGSSAGSLYSLGLLFALLPLLLN